MSQSKLSTAIAWAVFTVLAWQVATEASAQEAPANKAAAAQAVSESGAAVGGEQYALLIGVHKYDKSSGLRPLAYTHNDILKTAELLREIGYRDENVIVMTESQEDPRLLPEKEKVIHQLTALLRDRTKQDSIIIGFAGHGVQFKEDKDSYFCPLDSNVENKETLISLGTVYEALEGCKAGFKLVLSDACRNDPFTPTTRGLSILQEDAREPDERPPSGIASFYSCSKDEAAFEDPDLRHGVFFHFVIKGLQGGADLDEDQAVTLPELEYFVKRRVSDYVRRYFNGKRQMPNLRGNTSGVVTLAKLPDEAISIKLPSGADDKKLAKPKKAAEENQPIKVSYTNGIGMPLLLIPEGDYLMGAFNKFDGYDKYVGADAMPQHRVRISRPFYLGVFEVTQREYQEIMGDNPSACSDTGENAENVRRAVKRQGQDYLNSTKTDFHPVENITWKQAVEFTKRLSKREDRVYRLPTEAEWEYAMRAGKQTEYPWDGDATADHHFFENSNLQTIGVSSPVGRTLPNRWGFYDMTGNVWEFCSDYYESEYYQTSPSVDPQGQKMPTIRLKVRRGYGYDGWSVRYAPKRGYQPETRASASIGFRVVLELTDEELKIFSNQKEISVEELRVLLPATSSLEEAKKSLESARKKFDAGERGSLADLKKALKLNPGYFLADVGQWGEETKSGSQLLYDLTGGNNQDFAKASNAYSKGVDLQGENKTHEAVAKYLEAFNGYPQFTWAANNLAYDLATCEAAQIRDPVGAIYYAESACRATGWQYWAFLGTLARAYESAGEFEKAAVVIEAYLRLSPESKLPKSGEPPVGPEEYKFNLERMRKQLPWEWPASKP